MSNKSSSIYKNNWIKMAKMITKISSTIRSYISKAETDDLMDHETILITLQVFSLICADKWKYQSHNMDELWSISKEVHRLVKLSVDAKDGNDMQLSAIADKVKSLLN